MLSAPEPISLPIFTHTESPTMSRMIRLCAFSHLSMMMKTTVNEKKGHDLYETAQIF